MPVVGRRSWRSSTALAARKSHFAELHARKLRGRRTRSRPPQTLEDVSRKVNAADMAADWRGVLKWEGRMEELMAGKSDTASE